MEDPDRSGSKSVDGQGRLYLGDDYAGEEVEFAVKKTDSEENND